MNRVGALSIVGVVCLTARADGAHGALIAKRCAVVVSRRGAPECPVELTEEQARHRNGLEILRYRGSHVVRHEHVLADGSLYETDGCAALDFEWKGDEMILETCRAQAGGVVRREVYADGGTVLTHQDAAGRPHAVPGSSVVTARFDLDPNGRVIRGRYFDASGAPTELPEGAAEVRIVRDARGLIARRCVFDFAGKPALDHAGVSCVETDSGPTGSPTEMRFFGVDGRPVNSNNGPHRITTAYDALGRASEVAAWDVDGKPVTNRVSRAFRFTYERDDTGFIRLLHCYGPDGAPVLAKDGFATRRDVPDAHGRTIDQSYFGVDGEPVASAAGFARVVLGRDSFGRIVERRFFLEDGTPGKRDAREAGTRDTLDDRGRVVRSDLIDAKGKPVKGLRGFASWRDLFDARRQAIRTEYLDEAGHAVAIRSGEAALERDYSPEGDVLRERYLDTSGNPVMTKGLFASVELQYDGARRVTGRSYFDAAHSPTKVMEASVFIMSSVGARRGEPGFERSTARERIDAARRAIVAGASFQDTLWAHAADEPVGEEPGAMGPLELPRMYELAREAIEPLSVGAVSDVVEIPAGFEFFVRTR
ncbi:MAG TPA: hypothetical protein VHE30_12520 [Polyangiaceae bacterium]|nr:hypothetical protein [Polyangiaceae bacterium]